MSHYVTVRQFLAERVVIIVRRDVVIFSTESTFLVMGPSGSMRHAPLDLRS